jgi:site-specific recombinase XerD
MKFLKLFSAAKPKKIAFVDLLNEYIEKSALENCLTEATVKKTRAYYSNISLFLHFQKMQSCLITDFKAKHLEELKFWLHKHLTSCTVSHCSRHLELCKRALKYAVIMEYIEYSPLEAVKTKRDQPKEVVNLELSEIQKLKRAQFASDIYTTVRDLYLFQCYTGLSYGDLWSFTLVEESNITWITNRRSKTEKTYCAQFTDTAAEILAKYSGHLPRLANQTYNRIIKEIALMLNIDKHLTTHTARKTFATLKNNEGYSLETIADMMGNTPEVARKHYINGTRDRIRNEIFRLTGFSGKTALN